MTEMPQTERVRRAVLAMPMARTLQLRFTRLDPELRAAA
jgi:hypothetical protein